jgi:antitoxin component YwqK of YwqJK toxin-antitoxin module
MISVAFAQILEVTDALYENGYPKSIKTYKESTNKYELIRETQWHKNGQQKEQATYRNGQRTGKWIKWNENGQKTVEEQYSNGELIKSIEYQSNGKKFREKIFEGGTLKQDKCWDSYGKEQDCK